MKQFDFSNSIILPELNRRQSMTKKIKNENINDLKARWISRIINDDDIILELKKLKYSIKDSIKTLNEWYAERGIK